jgi:hypothetical protein
VPYIDRATLCQALHVLWQPALIPVRISPLGAQTPIVADVCPCGLGGCDGRAGWRIERRLARPVFFVRWLAVFRAECEAPGVLTQRLRWYDKAVRR